MRAESKFVSNRGLTRDMEVSITRSPSSRRPDARLVWAVPDVEGVRGKRLFASVIEDRYHDRVALGQGPTNLDLAVAPLITTIELENSLWARTAADDDLRMLAQLTVRHLGSIAVGLDAGEEKLRQPRVLPDGRGGKRLRSCAVIFRIFSEPSLTWRRIASSFARRFSAARSACVRTERAARSAGC